MNDVLRNPGRATLAGFHKGHVLGLAALVTPIAQAYSWPIVTPIMAVAALAVLVVARGRVSRPPFGLAVLLTLLAVYGAASGLWGLSERLALKTVGTIVATAIPGIVLVAEARHLDPAERRWFDGGIAAGFIIGLANMELLALTNGEIFGSLRELAPVQAIFGPRLAPVNLVTFDKQLSLLSMFAWPVVAVVWRRHGALWSVAIAAAAVIVTLQGISGTAKLACLSGCLAFVLAWLVPRWSAAAVGVVLALWIALAPALYQSRVIDWGNHIAAGLPGRIGNSIKHRRAIWEFAAERISERPLLGWGLGGSRVMPGGHEMAVADGAILEGLEAMPLHPHNAALQLWLELGVAGMLLGVAFVGWVARSIATRASRPVEQAALVALAAATTINAAGGYNLWHTWWMTFIWLGAAFAIAATHGDDELPDTSIEAA